MRPDAAGGSQAVPAAELCAADLPADRAAAEAPLGAISVDFGRFHAVFHAEDLDFW